MKRAIAIFLPLLFGAIVSTAQMEFISTNGDDIKLRKTTKSEQRKIVFYLQESEVPNDIERIGILLTRNKDRAEAYKEAKRYAAKAGGDAILIVDAKDMTTADKVANHFVGGNYKGAYYFNVYRFKGDYIPARDASTTRDSIYRENENQLADENGLYIGQKVHYLVTPNVKRKATIVRKISSKEYVLDIQDANRINTKKTPLSKIEPIK